MTLIIIALYENKFFNFFYPLPLPFLLIDKKDDCNEVAYGGKIYKQMPHQMVVLETLHRIEDCTYGIEQAAYGYQYDEWQRRISQKQRKEKYYCPAHQQIYSQAQCRYRPSAQRFIQYAEDYGHPLNNEYQNALPSADYIECNGCI